MASLTLRHYDLVFACFITATFAWGLGFYSFGFYLDALQKVHGWPTGVVAGTVAVHSLITGAAGILVGRWLTRLGPRTVLLGGSLAMAVGSYGIGYSPVDALCRRGRGGSGCGRHRHADPIDDQPHLQQGKFPHRLRLDGRDDAKHGIPHRNHSRLAKG